MAQLPHRPSSRVGQSGRVGVLGLLTIVILLGAGCSGPDEPANAVQTTADPGSAQVPTLGRTSTSPPRDPTPSDTASDAPPPPSITRRTGPTSTPQETLPGGYVGINRLAEHGWIDADGVLRLKAVIADIGPATGGVDVTIAADNTTTGATDTPANAGRQATAKSLCAFLFGTARQVAAIALLPGEPRLDPASGYQPGATGSTIGCVYDLDGDPALVLQVTHGPPIDPNLPGSPIVVTVGALQAALSYAPGYAGGTITRSLARDWLTAVAGRVATG